MSNSVRVVFTNHDKTKFSPIIYLHWNGGTESVVAFLKILNKVGFHDVHYAGARFTQICGNFLDEFCKNPSSTGIGIEGWSETLRGIKDIPEPDNGVFFVEYNYKRDMLISRIMNGEWVYKRLPLETVYEMLGSQQTTKCDNIYNEYDVWWN